MTPNSNERIKKNVLLYIKRCTNSSGRTVRPFKIFSTEFACLVAKTKKPLIRFNISSDTVPDDLLGKIVGDKNSLAGISS